MTAGSLAFMPDVLEEHLEELAFLWGQRRAALRDPDYRIREFSDLEERITAHLRGILAVGDMALPLLEETLSEGDSLDLFAAAYSLLHFGSDTPRVRVLDAFSSATGERLDWLREALCFGPLEGIQQQVAGLFHSDSTAMAAAAAQVLAFHSALNATTSDVVRFLEDAEPTVRTQGWRLAGFLGVRADPKTYAAAMREADPRLRSAALEAGAWCGEPGVLAVARKLAESPSADNLDGLYMLAVLGAPEDFALIETVASAPELGPDRFRLIGAYGHPGLMPAILEALASDDAATASTAGAAFTKMTSLDIESGDRASLPPADGREPDEFEAEFLDEVMVPDPEKARFYWGALEPKVGHAPRLCRGYDVSAGLDRVAFAALDMQSRWEVCLRARYSGAWDGSPLSLEVFPQGR
jgi:uncharacterized protein (TIGR02270 family)